MRSSTIKLTLLLFIHPCTVGTLEHYVLYVVFLIHQQVDNSLEGKYTNNQTQYKSFSNLTHPLLYLITCSEEPFFQILEHKNPLKEETAQIQYRKLPFLK